MMNEKRIRLMTKLADFEQHNGEMLYKAGTYYCSDYVSAQMMKNLFRITAAYLIGLGLWACYRLDWLLERLNTMDILGIGMGILITYGVILAVSLRLKYLIFSVKYFQAESQMQTYRNMLDRLIAEYDNERGGRRRRRERRREVGGSGDGGIDWI